MKFKLFFPQSRSKFNYFPRIFGIPGLAGYSAPPPTYLLFLTPFLLLLLLLIFYFLLLSFCSSSYLSFISYSFPSAPPPPSSPVPPPSPLTTRAEQQDVPQRVLQHRDQKLHSQGRGHHRQTRPGHCTLLVQSAVPGGLEWEEQHRGWRLHLSS